MKGKRKARILAALTISIGWISSAGVLAQSAEATGGPDSPALTDSVPGDGTAAPTVLQSEGAPTNAGATADEPTDQAALDTIPISISSESTAPEPSDTPPRNRILEEVVVTAQKRAENVMDVPISIQAFSEESLSARGISDQSGLQNVTPSLSVSTLATYATFFLRGVGSDAFVTGDPSVANYVDGVYLPFAAGMVQEFGAVERIEVLKGPQGTLFGRNTVGGAIVVTTKNPDLSEMEGSLQFDAGNYEDRKARIYVSTPLIQGRLALSVAGVYRNNESYYRGSEAGGKELLDDNTKAVRLKLKWLPHDQLEVVAAALRLKGENSYAFTLNREPNDVGRALGITPQRGRHGELSVETPAAVDNKLYYGTVSYAADSFDTKLLASDQKTVSAGTVDFDGSPMPIAAFTSDSLFAKVKTAEWQVISNSDSWGADWLKWIGGVYLFEADQGLPELTVSLADVNLMDGTLAGISLPAGVIQAFADALGPLIDLPTGELTATALQRTKSSAIFAQTTISFTDRIALTLGARYQEEKRKVLESNVGLVQSGGRRIILNEWTYASDDNGDPFPFHAKTTSLKPKVSLELHPFADELLIYLSYQEAVKSGVFNPIAVTERPSYVSPENTTAYELGFKVPLFNGRTRLEAAAFWYDTEDVQTQYVSLTTGGAVSFENAGAVRIRGLEFGLTSELFPDTIDGLVLSLGGTYLDARYRDYQNARGFEEVAGICCISSADNDYSGTRAQRAPEFTGVGTLSKLWGFENGAVDASLDGYYNTGYFHSSQNNPVGKQGAYDVYSVRTSYIYDRWDLRLSLYCNNLLDAKYSASVLTTDFGNLYSFAPPRTYGIRLNWEFS